MDYNTNRSKLIMPEYGRHIQKLVDNIKTIKDPTKRQKNAEVIIELMGALNPHLKIVQNFRHILWDHLFQIADFDLDIESPYPKPTKQAYGLSPEPIPYPEKPPKELRHLGRNIGSIMKIAIDEEDEEKKEGLTNTIAYYMKLSYANWHQEMVSDNVITEELKEITNNKLEYDDGDIKVRVKPRKSGQNRPNGKHRSRNGRNRKNNHRKRSHYNGNSSKKH